ncbi:MAG: hypothetical protein PVF27_09095 [Gemmatimonadales bacterium]|jgi:hypothetical protein
MSDVPTRWRTSVTEQLDLAKERTARAERHLVDGDGGRALQEAYPAAVAAATVQVWLETKPWGTPLGTDDLQRRVRSGLPSLFAALVEQDLQQVLTSTWRPDDAEPYVRETREFVAATEQRVESWLEQN